MAVRPVVFCTIDRLGLEGLSALPKTFAALEGAPRGTLDPLADDAAYFTAGTGEARVDVRAEIARLASAGSLLEHGPLESLVMRAEFEKGTFTDFMTNRERHRCAVHILTLASDVLASGADRPAVLELMDALEWRELPFYLHVVLDGPTRRSESEQPAEGSFAQRALEIVERHLGRTGKIATLMGADYALGDTLDWERAVLAHRAIVRDHEPPPEEKWEDALRGAYQTYDAERAFAPMRIAGYDGVTGSLQGDFANAAGGWAWHGFDIGIVASARPDVWRSLVALLMGHQIPEAVAAQIAIRERPMFAFETETIASFGRIGDLPVPTVVETRSGEAGLVERLASTKKVVQVFEASQKTLATWTFRGEREAPGSLTLIEQTSAASALATARARAAEADLVHVAIEPAIAGSEALAEIDTALADLATTVLAGGGALFLLVNDGPVVVTADPLPGDRGGWEPGTTPRTHAEVFTAVLAACRR